MSEVQQPQTPQQAPHSEAPQPIGPGQLLKNARLARHLSLQQIGKRIHLKASLLEELENDQYDQSISMTFIKGYLKLYARQVDVTEADIIDALDTLNMHKKEPAKLQSFSRRVAHQANDDKLMLVTYLILAVVVALVVIWWIQQDNKDTSVSGPQISAETTLQSADIGDAAAQNEAGEERAKMGENAVMTERFVPQPATPEPQQIDVMAPSGGEDNLPVEESSVTTLNTERPSAMDNIEASTAVGAAGKVQLIFEFTDDCWMSLTDATGEKIAYGVKVAGRVMTISGVPPFNIILGAPGAVKINYSGEDVDMSKFNAGHTADFSLPLI